MLNDTLYHTHPMTNIVKISSGTYYFRYIIPKNERKYFPNHKREYRKSLQTNIKRVALQKAHFLYVELKNKMVFEEKKQVKADIDELDSKIAQHEKNIQIGNKLYLEEKRITEYEEKTNDFSVKDNFLSMLSSHDMHCLDLATQFHEKQKNNTPTTLNQTSETSTVTPESAVVAQSDFTMQHTIDKYLDEKKVAIKTHKKYKSECLMMVRIMDIKMVSELDEIKVRKYKETLPKLPSNINSTTKLKNKKIDEILKLNLKPTIEEKTIKNQFTTIRNFLKFLYSDKYVKEDYSLMLLGIIKRKKEDSEERAVFSTSDLNKIFAHREYQSGFKKQPEHYWFPLLALYSGMRLNEIARLLIKNIHKEEGILLFDVSREDERKTKTIASIRKIPVHKVLIKLGLLEYIAELQSKNETKLFPMLIPDENGDAGEPVSRWFNRTFINQCRIEKKTAIGTKVFHSFRHSIIDQGKQQLLNLDIITEIVGHNSDNKNNETRNRYAKVYKIKIKKKEIDKIDFKITLPPKWEKSMY